MSSLIRFQHGPFQGWRVQRHGSWGDGGLNRVTVQIESPSGLSGLFAFTPGIEGWEQAWAAEVAETPQASAALLEWLIEATAVKLDRSTDIAPEARRHWQRVVDEADHSRAEFFAVYPDGRVPAFEVVGELIYDADTDTLAAAA